MTENMAGRRPRVLVGVDGSPAARAALEFAVREATLRDAVLVAVTAVDIPDYGWIDGVAVRIHPEDETVELVRQKLEQILAGAGTEGLEVDPIVRTMPAAKILIEQSRHCDLLVVGSRGRGGFRGLVMGSVSMQCVLHAHCPVTVVHSEPDPSADTPHQIPEDARQDTTAAPFF